MRKDITIRDMMNLAGTSELNNIEVHNIVGEEVEKLFEGGFDEANRLNCLTKQGCIF